jgi:inward rectifier potassium channel
MALFEPSPLAPRRTPEEQERDRDLGFGSVVSRAGTRRLLNRDGSFNVVRTGLGLLESFAPYHLLLTISWPCFLALAAVLYVVLNMLFALAYMALGPDALLGSGAMFGGPLGRAFFFSVETFATIGYGQLSPNGVPANLIVTFEALVGLMYQALTTGLLFARFARPTASILFSERAVVAPYGKGIGLMFRIVNRRRRNEIIELAAQVLYSAVESDGIRRYKPMTLERNQVTFFPLSWTIVHPIDETSPLSGKAPEELHRTGAEILVLLSGIDETFEQTVHTRSSYRAEEIVWNARFQSIFRETDGDTRTQLSVDVSRVHDIEPTPGTASQGSGLRAQG